MACAAHMMPTSAAAQLGVKRRAARCRHEKRQRSWRCRMKTGVSEHTLLISSRGGNHFPANCISAKPRTTRTHCHQPDRAPDLSQILVPNPPVQITAIDGQIVGTDGRAVLWGGNTRTFPSSARVPHMSSTNIHNPGQSVGRKRFSPGRNPSGIVRCVALAISGIHLANGQFPPPGSAGWLCY